MLWFFNLWFNHKLSDQVLLELDMNVPNLENWLFCFVVSEMCLLFFGLHRLHVMNMFTCHVYVYSDSHNMFLMYSDLKKFYFARQCKWNSLLRLEKVWITPTVKWFGNIQTVKWFGLLRPHMKRFWFTPTVKWFGFTPSLNIEMVWITPTMKWFIFTQTVNRFEFSLFWLYNGLSLLRPWTDLSSIYSDRKMRLVNFTH